VEFDGEVLSIELSNKSHSIGARVRKNITGELKAPESGNMCRRIKESNDSVVDLTLNDKAGNIVFQETGQRGGLEISGKIFDYLNDLK